MLHERDVIRYLGDRPRAFRVVWCGADEVVLFDLDAADTRLARRPRAEVVDDLLGGAAEFWSEHRFDRNPNPARVSVKQRERRRKLMAAIDPMLARAPDVFDDRLRGRWIAELERDERAKNRKDRAGTAKTIHAAFDRYWRRGMSENALTPDFQECGRGERKQGVTKLGRRIKGVEPERQGPSLTPRMLELFEKGLLRFFRNNGKNSLKVAYDLTLADFFVDHIEDPGTGRIVQVPKAEFMERGYPSFRQFQYWYSKRPDILEIRRKRAGPAKYDKDMRGIVGTAVAGLMGPGSRFEIDSTPLDIDCVAEIGRTLPVGRPTFYQVTDVLTKLVCGVYVGFEKASWLAAGLAVRNVVEDKVEFCRSFGVDIAPGEWDCQGLLPARFMSDRGEWEGYDASAFVAKSTVTVEVAAPYRGDQKGSTEKKFDMFHRLLRTKLDGMVEKKVKERGDRDTRLGAVLTLREVTAAVIRVTLFLNNHNELTDYPLSRGMIADGVSAIPAEMWRWSRDRGMDELRRADVRHVEFAMLPAKEATVTERGYRFKTLLYEPVHANHMEKFDRACQDRVSKVVVSYHTLHTTNIYLHDDEEPGGFIVLELTGHDKRFHGIAFDEVKVQRQAIATRSFLRRHERVAGMSQLSRGLGTLNKAANDDCERGLTPSDLKGVRENAAAERARERAAQTTSLPRTVVGAGNTATGAAGGPLAGPEAIDDDWTTYLG